MEAADGVDIFQFAHAVFQRGDAGIQVQLDSLAFNQGERRIGELHLALTQDHAGSDDERWQLRADHAKDRFEILVDGDATVLDLGANVDCSAEHLLQFAVMGSALVAAAGKESPTVGLLNIGEEVI